MSRQPIGKGERVTIILNPAIPKEKVILDYLSKSFNKSSDIKGVLYQYCINNQLGMINNTMINECTINDKSFINKYVKNNNESKNELSHYDNKSFEINLEAVEDVQIEIEDTTGVESATSNALEFMLNM